MSRYSTVTATSALILLTALSACQKAPNHDAPDEAAHGTAGNTADPALAGALGKRIVVDPAKTGRRLPANNPSATVQRGASASPPGAKCDFRYDAAWAGKLPPELPVYPGGRVAEAAGSDAVGCRRRIVSFTSAAPAETVIAYYRAHVTKAGYSYERLADQGKAVLGGTRGDAAYYVTVTPAGSGSAVDLVANGG